MNERFKQATGTRRFKWGVIGTVASALFLLASILLSDSAQNRLDRITQDPRFSETTWISLSVEEQQHLSRELMSARNNLGQIAMGKVLFSITLTLSLLLLIVSFVRIKDKVENFIEKEERTDK